jgi:hypothetical protein
VAAVAIERKLFRRANLNFRLRFSLHLATNSILVRKSWRRFVGIAAHTVLRRKQAISHRHSGTHDCLPGNLLLVGVFTNNVFDEFYPFINIARIDDNRSRYDVAERVHPDLLVEVKDLHRKIALEPEPLAV